MENNKIPYGKVVLFIGFSGLLLWWLFRDINWHEQLQQFKAVKLSWLLIGLLFSFTALVFRALRWKQMTEAIGYKINGVNSLLAINIGYGANYIFPRLGEVLRCVYLNKSDKVPVPQLVGTVVVERLIDVLITLLFIFIVIIAKASLMGDFLKGIIGEKLAPLLENGWLLAAIALLGLVLIVFIWKKWIATSQHNFILKLKAIILQAKDGLLSVLSIKNKPLFILYSLGIWGMYLLCTYFAFFSYSFTENLTFTDAIFVTVLGAFGMSAPVQGGFGAYHFIIEKGLLLYGIHAITTPDGTYSPGLVFASVVHGTQFLFTVFISIISWFIFTYRLSKTTALS